MFIGYHESYRFKYRGQGWPLLRPVKDGYHKSNPHLYKWIKYMV